MRKNKILIAGVGSFIGVELAASFLEAGVSVTGIDTLIGNKKGVIDPFLHHKNFSFIECDINHSIPESLRQIEWGCIVFVSHEITATESKRLELNQLLYNSIGTKQLLDIAVKTKSRFVMTSTVGLYQGVASQTNLKHYYDSEATSSLLSFYEAKRYAEALCQEYAEIYGLDVRIARLSEVYGPGMDLSSAGILHEIMSAAIQKEDLILDEDGSREVYVTYISDVVFGLHKVCVTDNERLDDGVFYFVNDEPVSVMSIVLSVKDAIKDDSFSIDLLPKVQNLLLRLPSVNLTRSKNDLYWEARVTLDEGINKTIDALLSRKKQQRNIQKVVDKPIIPQVESEQSQQENEDIATVQKPSFMEKMAERKVEVKKKEQIETFSHNVLDVPASQNRTSAKKAVTIRATSLLSKQSTLSSSIVPNFSIREKASSAREAMRAYLQRIATSFRTIYIPTISVPKITISKPAMPKANLRNSWSSIAEKTRQAKSNLPARRVLIPGWLKSIVGVVLITIFLWFVVMPIAGLGFHVYSIRDKVHDVRNAASSMNFDEAKEHVAVISTHVDSLEFYWQQSEWLWRVLGKDVAFVQTSKLFTVAHALVNSSNWAISFMHDLQPWWGPLVRGEDSVIFEDLRDPRYILRAQLSWRLFRENIELASAVLDDIEAEPLLMSFDTINATASQVRAVADVVQIDDTAWQQLPSWLGYEGEQHVAVLLQNNNELRAGGGFIGSYMYLRVNNGVIQSIEVDDIYNPDGQLEQKITSAMSPAPEGVVRFFSTDTLGLRDANWWPDFPTTGEKFVKLFDYARDIELDWVVGVNLLAIENILDILGPIELAESGTQVSADTLFEQAQSAGQVDFEPGSTGKEDFIREIVQQLWLALFPFQGETLVGVSKAVGEQIVDGQIALYSAHHKTQELLSSSTIAGEMLDAEGDFLAIVSTNVGGNKSNHWVTRSSTYDLAVDREGRLVGNLDILFSHAGTSDTWPGGRYQDYLRIYMPLGVKILNVEGFSGNVEIDSEFGKTVLAGLIDVEVGMDHRVLVQYDLPETIRLREDAPYNLVYQGQPGIDAEAFNLELNIPFYLSVEKLTGGAYLDDASLVGWRPKVVRKNEITVVVSRQQ